MTHPALARRPARRALVWAAALGTVPLLWRWVGASALGDAPTPPGGTPPEAIWGPLGTDAALWGLTAADLGVGASPLVPPVYPGLIAAWALVSGGALVQAGTAVSLAAASVLPLAVCWAALGLGARPLFAGIAALLLAVSPDLLLWSQQLQPESLSALAVVLLGGLLARAGAARGATMGVVLLGAGLPLLREHGLLLAPLAGVGLALGRPGGWRAGLALLGLAWLLPILGGWSSGWPPLAGPWSDRAGGALAALTGEDPAQLGFLTELRRPEREAYLALVSNGDVIGRVRWHASRSLSLAVDAWGWWAAAVALVLTTRWRRGLPVALLLLSAAPALLIWSQRRHVSLLLPLALCLVAAGLGRLWTTSAWAARVQGVVGAVLVGALAWSWPLQLPDLASRQLSETVHASQQARISAELCSLATPGDLLGTRHQELGLGCPLPRHDPDGSLADWRAWVLAEGPPATIGSWERVDPLDGELGIWRLEPARRLRPCQEAPLPTSSAHLAVEQASVSLVCTDVDPRRGPE